MKLPTYQFVAQMLAACGVMFSLGLVAYELKQSRDIAIADVYQARSAMWLDYASSMYSPEQYEAAVIKQEDPEEKLSPFDIEVLSNVTSNAFTYFENVHFQYQQGLITEEEWISTKENVAAEFSYPCTHTWWQEFRGHFRKSFINEVEGVIHSMETGLCETSLP